MDDGYCINFNAPGSTLELIEVKPSVRKELQIKNINTPFVEKDKSGSRWLNMRTTNDVSDPGGGETEMKTEMKTYYVVVFQYATQRESDQRKVTGNKGNERSAQQQEHSHLLAEGCSCLFGNPCLDEYNCDDWTNRYDVAKENGWSGVNGMVFT